MSRVLAVSDLHVRYRKNREAIEALPNHSEDWLLVPGDIGDTFDEVQSTFQVLQTKFEKVIWTPGNHELWSRGSESLAGVERYEALIELARTEGILTPEDPWPIWDQGESPIVIAPVFLLYDWSFRPAEVPLAKVKEWAAEKGIRANDDRFIHATPYDSVADWCAARCDATFDRLKALPHHLSIVLVNHYPLRADLVRFLPRIKRYSPWCGTTRTSSWHRDLPIKVVVNGHLHMRATDWIDGVRFEEVAIGYPRHWQTERPLESYLREILPGPAQTIEERAGPFWHP